jgi:hypothetical protein
MADPNRPLGGFANPNFVLINGVYWSKSGNRRYVQAHAWIVEFANILLEWVQNSVPDPRWTEGYHDENKQQWIETENKPLWKKGPLEIIKYIEHNSFDVIIKNVDPNYQYQLQQEMYEIRKLRNRITHENIKNSKTLKTLLSRMKKVCE